MLLSVEFPRPERHRTPRLEENRVRLLATAPPADADNADPDTPHDMNPPPEWP